MPSTQFTATTAIIAAIALQGCSDSSKNPASPTPNYPNATQNLTEVKFNSTGKALGLAKDYADVQFQCTYVKADNKNYTDWKTCWSQDNSTFFTEDTKNLMFSKLPAGANHTTDFYSLNSTSTEVPSFDHKGSFDTYSETLTLAASWAKSSDKVGGDEKDAPQQIGMFATKYDLCTDPVVWDPVKGPVTAYKVGSTVNETTIYTFKNIYFDHVNQTIVQEQRQAPGCSLADGDEKMCTQAQTSDCSFDFSTQCSWNTNSSKCDYRFEKGCPLLTQTECKAASSRCALHTDKSGNETCVAACLALTDETECKAAAPRCAWHKLPLVKGICFANSTNSTLAEGL
jgi:hypothetical protein